MNTSQYTELERIKLKIKALANKTVGNGATEHEALAAMNVVGRLLTQYNLTMNELDVRDASYKTIYVETNRKRRHPIDNSMMALADLFGAKVWFHKRWAELYSAYAFFGQQQDLDMIEYLYKVMSTAIDAESSAFKKTETYLGHERRYRKTAYVNFQKGMAYRLSDRLRKMKRDTDTEIKGTGTALIVLKSQLTEEAFEKIGMKLGKAYHHHSRFDGEAYDAGRVAGDKVNLSRPLKSGAEPKGYLA